MTKRLGISIPLICFLFYFPLWGVASVLHFPGPHRGSQSSSSSNGVTSSTLIVDGVHFKTLAETFAACPALGCIIDMRGNSNAAALNIGFFDPGSRPVALLLGPYIYSVNTITLETNFLILGNKATLQSISTKNEPVFVLPSTNNGNASGVTIRDVYVMAAVGNTTQDGFFLDCSNVKGGGLMYSFIYNVTLENFNGATVHMRGPSSNFSSNNQFTTWQNISAYRGPRASAGEALRIEGASGNMTFIDDLWDAPAGTHHGSAVYLGVSAGGTTAYPYSLHFLGNTIQDANIGVTVNGSLNLEFRGTHWENILTGAYLFTNGTFNIGTIIDGNHFASNVAVNGGKGYIVNSLLGGKSNVITFTNNTFGQFGKPPDNVLTGAALWTACGNFGPSSAFQPCQFTGQALQAVSFEANKGAVQTASNISLGSGWGTDAKVAGVSGWTQTQQFTIVSGSSSFSSAPTVSVTFPNAFSQEPLCRLIIQDIAGDGGPLLFSPSFISRDKATFTTKTSAGGAFTPAPNETYKVLLTCGP